MTGLPEMGEEKKNKIVIEIGTDGKPFFLLGNRKLQSDERYFAIDVDKGGAKRASQMLNRLDVDKQSVPVQADAHKLPFANETVDECVLTNVFGEFGPNHPNYYGTMLQEIVRVLKKNGKISITETYTTPDFVPEFMKVTKNQDGTPTVNEAYFKKLGLLVKSVDFALENIKQYDKYISSADVFGDNFHLTLVKE